MANATYENGLSHSNIAAKRSNLWNFKKKTQSVNKVVFFYFTNDCSIVIIKINLLYHHLSFVFRVDDESDAI